MEAPILREVKREQWRRWAAKNQDYLRERDRKRRTENRDEFLAMRREWYAKNPERHRERLRAWRAAHPDKAPTLEQIRLQHAKLRSNPIKRERERQKERERRRRNPEKWKEYALKYQSTPKGKARKRELLANYRARKLNATPRWLNDEDREKIRNIYQEAERTGLTVDHIYPLKGKTVCGLHVPRNLQLLPAGENSKKGNKMEEIGYWTERAQSAEAKLATLKQAYEPALERVKQFKANFGIRERDNGELVIDYEKFVERLGAQGALDLRAVIDEKYQVTKKPAKKPGGIKRRA